MRRLLKPILSLTFSTLAACGGQLVEFPLDTDTDVLDLPPTVVLTDPPDGATDVALVATVLATFSEPMDAASIDEASFTVTNGGTVVAGVVTVDATGFIATFTPAATLNGDLVYTGTITNDVQDVGGLNMVDDYTWTFTTRTGPVPPTVIATFPTDTEIDVGRTTVPTATFSMDMDPSTMTASTFLLNEGANSVSGTVSFNGPSREVTFTPDDDLEYGRIYTATITDDVRSDGGVAMVDDYTWTFITRDAPPAPQVISTFPVDLATDVDVSVAPRATFDIAMNQATLSTSTFLLSQGLTSIPGSVTYDTLTREVTFTPDDDLEVGTLYTATVTTGVASAAGIQMAADYTWTFLTEAATIAPTVIVVFPVDDSVQNDLDTFVTATFSTPMDPATIDSASFFLEQGTTLIPSTVSYDVLTRTATLVPDSSLNYGATYRATVRFDVEDLLGTPMGTSYVWHFHTENTPVAPIVVDTFPENGAIDVATDANLTATFNVDMDPATLTTASFLVRRGLTPVLGTVSYDTLSYTATFVPDDDLVWGDTYTATITDSATDTSGTTLAADYVWMFTVTAPIAPTVITTVPLNGAVDVALDITPTATFSTDMDPTSLDATTFRMRQGLSPVLGFVSYDALTNTVTFEPLVDFVEGAVYTATLDATVRDTAGTPMGADYVWSFTTVAPIAPMVISTNPENGDVDVNLDVNITATFSTDMDPASLSAATVRVRQGLNPVLGLVSYDALTNTVTFDALVDLIEGAVYTATIDATATDLAGTPMDAEYVWSFTTLELVAPFVVSTNPENGELDVSIDTTPTATFSTTMDPASLSNATFEIWQGLNPVLGVVSYDALTNTVTFEPTFELEWGQVYTATIDASVTDLAGTPMDADYTWTFSTLAPIAPTVIATYPEDEAIEVPVDAVLTATFSTQMDLASLTDATFLVALGLTPVAGTVSYDALTSTASFHPDDALVRGGTYTATLTDGVMDLLGTQMDADYVWSFTVVEPIAPIVVATFPLDGATDVSVMATPTATFDRAMDPMTMRPAYFVVTDGITVVPGEVTYDDLTFTATFVPDNDLANDTTYTATITTGARSDLGTRLAMDYSWEFTTIEPAPTIVATTPEDGSTTVGVNSLITATFDKDMDPASLNALTFTVSDGLVDLLGFVTYDPLTWTATFTPDMPLTAGVVYDATVTTGAEDLGGIALEFDYTWSFGADPCGLARIVFGDIENFAAIASSAITSTGPTAITGDIAVSPGSSISGFPPGTISGSMFEGDATAATAMALAGVSYLDAAGRTLCSQTVAGNLGGQTLTPGLYTSTSSIGISSGTLTLDAQGDSSAVFIFQAASTFITSPGLGIVLAGGADPANIYWQVGSSATIGTTSAMYGTIMASASVTMNTGATLTGRVIALNGAVTMDANTIVVPTP